MNPYAIIPPVGRLWQLLVDEAHALGQRTFQTTVRQLAARLGFASAGKISQMLRQLAIDGHIAYDGTLITVLAATLADSDPVITPRDRSPDVITAAPERSRGVINEIPQQDAANDEVITPRDRSLYRVMRVIESESESAPPAIEKKATTGSYQRDIYLYLKQLGVPAGDAYRAACSGVGGMAELQEDLARAQANPRTGHAGRLVAWAWGTGDRLGIQYVDETPRPPRQPSRPDRTKPRGPTLEEMHRNATETIIPDAKALGSFVML